MCVLVLVAAIWGCLKQVPERPSICASQLRLAFLESQGAVPPGSNPRRNRLFLKKCRCSLRHFGAADRVLATVLLLVPAIKSFVPFSCVSGALDKYQGLYQTFWLCSPGPLGRDALSQPCSLIHGSGRVWFGFSDCRLRLPNTGTEEAQHRVSQFKLTLFGLRGAVALGSYLFRQGSVHCLTPESPIFRGMPTGLKAFLEPPSMSRLRSCTWLPC